MERKEKFRVDSRYLAAIHRIKSEMRYGASEFPLR
jgi:hypothetical protein